MNYYKPDLISMLYQNSNTWSRYYYTPSTKNLSMADIDTNNITYSEEQLIKIISKILNKTLKFNKF